MSTGYCQEARNGLPCPEHPLNSCQFPSEKRNALESPLTASQQRLHAKTTLMDWMEANQINFDRASNICGVSTHAIAAVAAGAYINPRLFQKISNKIPGLSQPGE